MNKIKRRRKNTLTVPPKQTMSLFSLFIVNFATAIAVMTAAWGVHLAVDKASVADAFWGPGFAVIAGVSFILSRGDPARSLLFLVLISIWALRLAFHVTRRSWAKPEDPRYADLRAKHPRRFAMRSLVTVFWLQAALMWVVALPAQLGIRGSTPPGINLLDGLGLLLWCAGLFWEAVGDAQLYRFKSNPANRGKILDRGLWRYSRHPNYFGEALMWWALALIACQVENGGWSLVGPAVLTLLLLKVSGIRMTEKTMRRSHPHPELDRYKRRVSAFIPWPPKGPTT